MYATLRSSVACLLLYTVLILCLALLPAHAQTTLKPEHVAVVYNASSPHSKQCAELYARTRQIPQRNLLALHVSPTMRDISMQSYHDELRDPLLAQAKQRNLVFPTAPQLGIHPIYAMVLMPDLPLRITPTPPAAGEKPLPHQQTSAASVDSELSVLGMVGYPHRGLLQNPYYKRAEGIAMSGFPVLLITRIDSPSRTVSRRMITQPAAIEKQGGLRGWTIVDAGGPYPLGDQWLMAIATAAMKARQPVFLDALRPSLVDSYPLPEPTSMYFGWYEGSAHGPFRVYNNAASKWHAPFQFAPGAVAVHIHSFSATNVRSSQEGWVGALLMKGADVSAGNAWEPFLRASLRVDLFYQRLLAGYTVAEAAGMATPVLSWQGVIMGDPLYRPYPSPPQPAAENLGMRASYDLIQKKYKSAAAGFARIVRESKDSAVQVRAALSVAQCQLLDNQRDAAAQSLERVQLLFPHSPHITAAKRMMQQHFPEPQSP